MRHVRRRRGRHRRTRSKKRATAGCSQKGSAGGGTSSPGGRSPSSGGGGGSVVVVLGSVVVVMVVTVVVVVVVRGAERVQSASQPSPLTALPSSHCSPASASRTPSPQVESVATKRRLNLGRLALNVPLIEVHVRSTVAFSTNRLPASPHSGKAAR